MPSTDPLETPSGGFSVCAYLLVLRVSCWHALLQADLFGEPRVNRSGAIHLNITEQSGGAALMNDEILYPTIWCGAPARTNCGPIETLRRARVSLKRSSPSCPAAAVGSRVSVRGRRGAGAPATFAHWFCQGSRQTRVRALPVVAIGSMTPDYLQNILCQSRASRAVWREP